MTLQEQSATERVLAARAHGNVAGLHVPLAVADEELDRGLAILEEAVGAAA